MHIHVQNKRLIFPQISLSSNDPNIMQGIRNMYPNYRLRLNNNYDEHTKLFENNYKI